MVDCLVRSEIASASAERNAPQDPILRATSVYSHIVLGSLIVRLLPEVASRGNGEGDSKVARTWTYLLRIPRSLVSWTDNRTKLKWLVSLQYITDAYRSLRVPHVWHFLYQQH